MTDPTAVIAYAPADLAGRPPPVWVGLACLAVAAVVLLLGGFLGVVAGAQAVQLWTGLRDAHRLAALPTRAMSPPRVARLTGQLCQSGPINPAQVRTVAGLLTDPAQPWVEPTGAAPVGYAVALPAGGVHVQLQSANGSKPPRMADVTLDAAGRLVKADAIDWSTEMRTTAAAAADGTVSTVTFHRQRAPPAVVLGAELTVAGLAVVAGLLAVGLAAGGVLLLAGRAGGWPLLRRLAWPLVVAGVGSILAAQALWWAATIGNTSEPAKAMLWCLPGLSTIGAGAATLAMARRPARS